MSARAIVHAHGILACSHYKFIKTAMGRGYSDEDEGVSEPENDYDNAEFPGGDDDVVVDFGWQDDEDKPLSGRRKKAHQAAKKKAKPGSFGKNSI